MKPRRWRPAVLLRVRRIAPARRTGLRAWRPLALCWMRAAPPASVARALRPVRSLHSQLHAQVHLHLCQGAAAAAPGSPTRGTRATPAIARNPATTREQVHHHNTHRKTAHFTVERGFTTPGARDRTIEHRVSNTRLERDRSSTTTTVALTFRTTSRATDAGVAGRRSVPIPVQRPSATTRTRGAGSTPPSAASIANAELRGELHAVPLVWQRAASASSRDAADGTILVDPRFAAAPANVNLAANAVDSQAQERIRQFAQEAQRVLLLDSALTERLADDVLRRVDKRLRIERERRGL